MDAVVIHKKQANLYVDVQRWVTFLTKTHYHVDTLRVSTVK